MHRLKGDKGGRIVYRMKGPILGWKMYVFYPGDTMDIRISGSSDNGSFAALASEKTAFFSGTGEYGYFRPILFHGLAKGPAKTFLRIEWPCECQIGRVEITYGQ
jgi:hypothetical protein